MPDTLLATTVPLPCLACGACEVPTIGPGTGPHVASLRCRACSALLKWAPRVLVQASLAVKDGGMTASVNRVVLLGTVSKYGVEVRYLPSGAPCASFALVLTELGSDGKPHQTWIPCEVYGKKAEAASDLEAGQLCLFEGKLAKRKKGEQWEMVVSGFDLTPVLAPTAVLTGKQ